MSSKFNQIRPLVSMATYRVTMEKPASSCFSAGFDRILFTFAGNNIIHESLDEFKLWLDSTTDYGVSCPLVYEKIS